MKKTYVKNDAAYHAPSEYEAQKISEALKKRKEKTAENLAGSPLPYQNFKYIVIHPDLLGGKPTMRGTRISVSQILECFASGMSLADINDTFETQFSKDAIAEVLSLYKS